MIRRALGFALVYSLGVGAAVLAGALARPATTAPPGSEVQHAVLTTDAGIAVPAVGSCPYLAQRSAAGSCPYLAGRAGGDCPARGGGGGSACPRAGRSSETPPADRAGRGAQLASMGSGAAPTAPADPA